MKKTNAALLSAAIMGASFYGAWMMYKKEHPISASKIKMKVNKAGKKIEKSMEDMM